MRRCLACEARFAGSDWRCPGCGWAPASGKYPSFAPDGGDDDDGYAVELFALMTRIEPGSFWFRARNRLIDWAVRRYFPAARSMLEVGSGTGFVLAALERSLPALSLTGGELYRAGLDIARGRVSRASLVQLDARHLPWDSEFDVVGSFDVLEHIEEDEDVLSQLHGASKPGGGLLLTVPQHPRLWSRADDFAHHVRRYTRSELLGKVRAAGFDVLRATSFVSLLLPLMAASRMRQRRASRDYDPLMDLQAPRAVDGVLDRVMTAERALIRRGVSFPAGGSLLLVGRRP